MFYLYANGTTNPDEYHSSSIKPLSLWDFIFKHSLNKTHFITKGRLKADLSNKLKPY